MSGKGWPERVANRAAATEEVTRAHCRQQTTKIPSGLAHFQIDPFESTLAKLCSLHLIAAIGILAAGHLGNKVRAGRNHYFVDPRVRLCSKHSLQSQIQTEASCTCDLHLIAASSSCEQGPCGSKSLFRWRSSSALPHIASNHK